MTVAEAQGEAAPTAAPDSSSGASHRRISYEPGLDGLRAIALLAIFVVHANVGLAPGGFLAVSTFFTLSGFLITALLVSEHRSNGRVALGSFWKRRARRLLPASLVAIALIGVLTLQFGDATQNQNLLGDEVGALAYVANWHYLLAGTTYAGEFAGQSPLLHFWSLAIEEQFYLLFPLVAVSSLMVTNRWKRALPVVLLVGIALSLTAGIVASGGATTPDRLYFRTDIRAGELLVGALFGWWWVNGGRDLSERFRQVIRVAGLVLLILMVSLIATSDYHDTFWYRGGLLSYSLVTVAVILAAVESRGPVKRFLTWKPLVWIGVVSYGAYLVHWPLFMWLYTNTSVPGAVRLVGGTAIALGIAYVSYRAVELPVREKRRYSLPLLITIGISLVAVALIVGAIAPDVARSDEVTLDQTQDAITDHIAYTAAAKGEAPTVGIYGDSTALVATLGLAEFDDEDTSIRMGGGWAGLGCTISAPAVFLSDGKEVRSNGLCDDWLPQWKAAAKKGDFDVALVQFGPWEVKALKPNGEGTGGLQTIGEPAQDAFVEQRLTEALDALVAETPVVVIATSPYVEPGRVNGRSPSSPQPDSDPARMDRLNEIIRNVASRYPNVAVMDLAGWVDSHPDERELRPDGVHFTDKVALRESPRYAATINSILDVAAGAEPPESDEGRFPVLQYAKPQ